MAYIFTTPTIEEAPAGGQRPFGRYRIDRGITLLKQGDSCTYVEVRYPTQDEIDAASAVYRGGFVYFVSDAEGTCLADAGYGSGLTEIGYGLNGYGVGPYGAREYGS